LSAARNTLFPKKTRFAPIAGISVSTTGAAFVQFQFALRRLFPPCNGLGSKIRFRSVKRSSPTWTRPLFSMAALGPRFRLGNPSGATLETWRLRPTVSISRKRPFLKKFPARAVQNMLLYGYPPDQRPTASSGNSSAEKKKAKGDKGFSFPGDSEIFSKGNFEESNSDSYREVDNAIYVPPTLCVTCHGKRLRPEIARGQARRLVHRGISPRLAPQAAARACR